MLSLDSPRWHELEDAYGMASDIPALLRELESDSGSGSTNKTVLPDLWNSLWSTLCHQSTVYPASYAAVPHLVRIDVMLSDPLCLDFFCLPARIELGRKAGYDRGRTMPPDLEASYFAAIEQLPFLLSRLTLMEWDEPTARDIASCLVGMKGQSDLASLIEAMEPDEIQLYHVFKNQEANA